MMDLLKLRIGYYRNGLDSLIKESLDWGRKIKSPIDRKSLTMETVLMRVPLPTLYIDTSWGRDRWKIIHGRIKVMAIKEYMEDEYALEGLLFYPELNGLKFSEIHRRFQRRIEEYEWNIVLVDCSDDEELRKHMYHRIKANII